MAQGPEKPAAQIEHPPFPFIVGRGRSGTTLLRAMFDSHPEMAIPPESHFLVPMALKRRRFENGGIFRSEAFVAELVPRYGFRRWDLDPDLLTSELAQAEPRSYEEAIRVVFTTYARSHGKNRYGEKTPHNVSHIALLSGLFPEGRFIHLIRDGRDVALSYLAAEFGSRSVGDAAIYWRRFVGEGRKGGADIGADRYIEVRYEDLTADPVKTLQRLCAFIEIDYHPDMLSYHERAGSLLQHVSYPEHHQRLSLPPTRGLRDWRRDMTENDLVLFEAIAGDLLGELGYERGIEHIPPSARVRAASAHVGVFARKVTGRLKNLRRAVTKRRRSGSDRETARVGTPLGAEGGS